MSRIHEVSRPCRRRRRRRLSSLRLGRRRANQAAERGTIGLAREGERAAPTHHCTSSRSSAPAAIFSCCLVSHDDSVVKVRSNPKMRKVQCMSCEEFCPQTLKAVAAVKKNQMQNGEAISDWRGHSWFNCLTQCWFQTRQICFLAFQVHVLTGSNRQVPLNACDESVLRHSAVLIWLCI